MKWFLFNLIQIACQNNTQYTVNAVEKIKWTSQWRGESTHRQNKEFCMCFDCSLHIHHVHNLHIFVIFGLHFCLQTVKW